MEGLPCSTDQKKTKKKNPLFFQLSESENDYLNSTVSYLKNHRGIYAVKSLFSPTRLQMEQKIKTMKKGSGKIKICNILGYVCKRSLIIVLMKQSTQS